MRGEGLDLGQGVLELPRAGVVAAHHWVERDGAQEPRIQLDGADREPGGFEVASHLHGALYAHRLGRVQGVLDADREIGVGEVQVRVVVHDRDRQRLRRGRIPLPPGTVAAGGAERDRSKGIDHPPTLTGSRRPARPVALTGMG